MRISDPVENPILSLTTAWFGGGSKGPSQADREAAARQQAEMQAAAARQAEAMRKQMEEQKRLAREQEIKQAELTRQMDANRPAPGAQVDTSTNAGDEAAIEALKRKGLRKSILAGESNQTTMTTGYSTLG